MDQNLLLNHHLSSPTLSFCYSTVTVHPAAWICVLALTETAGSVETCACLSWTLWWIESISAQKIRKGTGLLPEYTESELLIYQELKLMWYAKEILQHFIELSPPTGTQLHLALTLAAFTYHGCAKSKCDYLGIGPKKSISMPNPWVCSALDAFPVVQFWAQCLSNVKTIETGTWSSPLTSWICCRCSTTSQVLSINWLQICVGWSNAGAAGILRVGCPAALRCMGMPLRRIGGWGGPAGCFWWRHWMQETNRHQWETYMAIIQKQTITIPSYWDSVSINSNTHSSTVIL